MSTVNSGSKHSAFRSTRPDVFVLLLLAASLCLNVFLGWRVQQGSTNGPSAKLSPGTKIEPVNALDAEGKSLTIAYDGTNKPTVVYVISPSCIWCRRNQANIDKIAETKAGDFRFVGLSLGDSGLKEYVQEHSLKFPVYAGVTKRTVEALGLGGTPQTIVVSPEGKVLKMWSGAFTEELRPDVEAFFGVQLPGLSN